MAHRKGSFGEIPAASATPLVLVVTELVQNAIEHAFPDGRAGTVTVLAQRRRGELQVTVRDDGVGLPEGFNGDKADRLGLSIVQTLVTAELGGEVDYRPTEAELATGTDAVLTMPVARRVRDSPGDCASGEPGAGSGVATLERAALVLGQAAPHAGVLSGLQGPRQALLDDRAASADRFRLLDLQYRGPGVPDREEQLRVLVTAYRAVPPIHR